MSNDDETYQVTVYQAVGGSAFFDRLADRFYAIVAEDDVLLPLYPDQEDLGPAAERLSLFLAQFWGGPTTYSDRRGHPRLRMRHNPYVIGEAERRHWLDAMLTALDQTMPEAPLETELATVVHQRMVEYFTNSAAHMVNAEG